MYKLWSKLVLLLFSYIRYLSNKASVKSEEKISCVEEVWQVSFTAYDTEFRFLRLTIPKDKHLFCWSPTFFASCVEWLDCCWWAWFIIFFIHSYTCITQMYRFNMVLRCCVNPRIWHSFSLWKKTTLFFWSFIFKMNYNIS